MQLTPVHSWEQQVGPCRDRVGTLCPQSTVGPPPCWGMARFVLNCLVWLDAPRSIWFKGEHLQPCNLWLPGGLGADSGIFASSRSLSAQQIAPCSAGWGAGDSPGTAVTVVGTARGLPHPLGHPQEHTRGRAWAPFWVITQVWLSGAVPPTPGQPVPVTLEQTPRTSALQSGPRLHFQAQALEMGRE